MNKSAFVRNYLLALLVFNLTACSSMQTVDVESAMRYPPPPGIDIGSLVEVKTLDARTLKFRVTDVTKLGLDGKYGVVAFEDMAQLKVDTSARNEGKKAGYILGALGIVALIALIGSADTVRVCSHSPCNER
jgi:hypothetical protein